MPDASRHRLSSHRTKKIIDSMFFNEMRPLHDVANAAQMRSKRARKRSVQVVHEDFELFFNPDCPLKLKSSVSNGFLMKSIRNFSIKSVGKCFNEQSGFNEIGASSVIMQKYRDMSAQASCKDAM